MNARQKPVSLKGIIAMNEKKQVMKKISRQMSIRMGLTLSFFLSVTGVLTGNARNIADGTASFPQLLISILSGFVVSLIISLIIGELVPVGKVTESATRNMKPGFAKRCVESLISDLIYTPVITLAMVSFSYIMVMRRSHGQADLHFLPMFLSSLAVCMIVGFILIFIFTPVYMKSVLRKNGIQPGGRR